MGAWERSAGVFGGGGLIAVLLALLVLCAVVAVPARADSSVNVNTTNSASPQGDGLCSLPEAVAYADGTGEPDCAPGTASGTTTINVPSNAAPYTLSGTLSISKDTTILGAGASSTTISGGGAVQVFNIASTAQVTISGVTISGGTTGNTDGCTGTFPFVFCPARSGLNGGGIANSGTLTLQNSVVTGNNTSRGLNSSGPLMFCISGNCFPSAGASAGSGGAGAGIYNAGQITIANSTISNNTAGAGGSGTDGSSGTGTHVSAGQDGGSAGNGGGGGGIFNDSGATATITNSTISGNAAGSGGNAGAGSTATASPDNGGNAGFAGFGGEGGGILNFGTLTMTGSTVAGNITGVGGNGATGGNGLGGGTPGSSSQSGDGGSGGGIFTSSSQTITLSDSTITGNTASAGGTGGAGPGVAGTGGGIIQTGLGLVALTFVTVDGNAALTGGGLFRSSIGSMTEADSIIASNTGSPAANCGGPMVTDDGHNLVFGDNSCPGTPADPKLAPLASNGGPTQTMALQPGSAAIDLVPTNACPLTTDQRGVARPQGPACDAGAYEFAPPSVGSVAGTANSTDTATVTVNINPNAKSTTVLVKYGPTTAYGSTTAPQTLSGNGSTPFSASLAGLTPNTTYHAQVTASNGDGTTNSGDFTFSTPAPVSASVVSDSTSGTQLSLTIACGNGIPGDTCTGPITLTSHVTTQAGKTIAVAAKAKKKPKPKPKPKPKTTTVVTLATGSYSIASGNRVTIELTLNSTGKKLLAQLYRVPATLTIGGTSSITTTVTFSYSRISSPVSFTWAFNSKFSVAQQLTISGLPSKPKVAVICHGHGCPFSKRTFSPHGKKLALASEFKHSHLAPRTTLELEIDASNDVGKVLIFTIRSGQQPSLAERCLPPGASRPTACA